MRCNECKNLRIKTKVLLLKAENIRLTNCILCSHNFSKDDFEEADNYIQTKKNRKIIKRILIFIGLLLITCSIIVGVYYLIK